MYECVCVCEAKGPYLQVSVVDTPAMAIINSVYKLLEISACFVFIHPSMVYLHNKKSIGTYITPFPGDKDGKCVLRSNSKAILYTIPMNDDDKLIMKIGRLQIFVKESICVPFFSKNSRIY